MRSFAIIAALCLVASVAAVPFLGGGAKAEAEVNLQLSYNNQGQILSTGVNYSQDAALVEVGLVDMATGGLYTEKLAALIEKAISSTTTQQEQIALARLHILNPTTGQIDVASFAHYGLAIHEDGIYVKGFKKVVGLTKTVASNLKNGTVTIFSGIFHGVKEAASGIWNGIGNAWKGAWGGAVTVGSGFVNGIKNFFGGGSKPQPTAGTIQAGGINNGHVNIRPIQSSQVVITGSNDVNSAAGFGGAVAGGNAAGINGVSGSTGGVSGGVSGSMGGSVQSGISSGMSATAEAGKQVQGGISSGVSGSFEASKNFGISGSAGSGISAAGQSGVSSGISSGSSSGIHASFDINKSFSVNKA